MDQTAVGLSHNAWASDGAKCERNRSMPEEIYFYLVDGNQLIWISFLGRAPKVAISFFTSCVHDRIKWEAELDRRIWAPAVMDKYHV